MKNYKLDIYTNPINKTCGFIYMGYQGNRLIVGYTNSSIADRYKKTAPWGNWFGIDLQSFKGWDNLNSFCLLYTSPSPRDVEESRMPSSA